MYVWSAHHEEKQIECIVNEWQARVEIAGVEGYAYTHFVCWTEKWTKNRRQQQNAVAKRMNKRNKSAVDRRVTAEYRRSLSLSLLSLFLFIFLVWHRMDCHLAAVIVAIAVVPTALIHIWILKQCTQYYECHDSIRILSEIETRQRDDTHCQHRNIVRGQDRGYKREEKNSVTKTNFEFYCYCRPSLVAEYRAYVHIFSFEFKPLE